jgi:hypothetical protein
METLDILLVEDDEAEYSACQAAVKYLCRAKICDIKLERCTSVADVEGVWKDYCGKLWTNFGKKFFDGAIVDLHLKNDEPGHIGGNEVIQKLEELAPRIPIAIRSGMTAHRAEELRHVYCVDRVSDEGKFENLLTRFLNIRKTGLIDIMSGSGEIERRMNIIFHKVLMPRIEDWIAHLPQKENNPEQALSTQSPHDDATTCGEMPIDNKMERAMLRMILDHLFTLLDEDNEKCFVEEFYISDVGQFTPERVRLGSLWKKDQMIFVVLTPACDLVIRSNGRCKTNRILIVEVDSLDTHCSLEVRSNKKIEKRKKGIEPLLKNTHTPYLHWIPPCHEMPEGGVVNFRGIVALELQILQEEYQCLNIQISHRFIKDMISRMSSYYARQGQPDLDIEEHLCRYAHQLTP